MVCKRWGEPRRARGEAQVRWAGCPPAPSLPKGSANHFGNDLQEGEAVTAEMATGEAETAKATLVGGARRPPRCRIAAETPISAMRGSRNGCNMAEKARTASMGGAEGPPSCRTAAETPISATRDSRNGCVSSREGHSGVRGGRCRSPALQKCSLNARFGNEGQPKWLHL